MQASSQLEAQDIQGLSKGVESIQMQSNQIYENVNSTDSDHSPPFRTDLSLVLSYSGNKSKYSTTQNGNKSQDSDVDTPTMPIAMKLLPNKLTYAGKTELKPINGSSQEVAQSIVNVENSANEEILSKSQVNSMHESCENNAKTSKIKEKMVKNGQKRENGENASSSGKKEKETNSKSKSKKRDSNDSQDSVKKNCFYFVHEHLLQCQRFTRVLKLRKRKKINEFIYIFLFFLNRRKPVEVQKTPMKTMQKIKMGEMYRFNSMESPSLINKKLSHIPMIPM